MAKEDMTSKERMEVAMKLGKPDRLPCINFMRETGMELLNMNFADCMKDSSGALFTKAAIAAYERYQHDLLAGLIGVHTEAEALGAVVETPDFAGPSVVEVALKETSDVDKLEIPELSKLDIIKRQCNIVKRLRKYNDTVLKKKGEACIVTDNPQSPFRCACMTRGTPDFLMDLILDPTSAEKLLKITTEVEIEFGKLLVDAGCDALFPSNPTGSGDLISRAHYEKFAFPYEKKVFATYKKMKMPLLFHICGHTLDRVDLMADTGANLLSVDQMTPLKEVKKLVGSKVAIAGNVLPSRILLDSVEVVQREAMQCALDAAEGGGYVLMAGCMYPPGTPAANMDTMLRVAKSYRYV